MQHSGYASQMFSVLFVVLGSLGSYLALSLSWQATHEGRAASSSPPSLPPHESTVAAGEDTFFKTKKATQN